jgi:hypothetical protein
VALATSRRSRWYPVEGGTRVVVERQENDPDDAPRWHVEKGARDHEHCDLCGAHVPAMTSCWVTVNDPYVLLCEACHGKVDATGAADKE